jgi:hypothetical protein
MDRRLRRNIAGIFMVDADAVRCVQCGWRVVCMYGMYVDNSEEREVG